MRIPWKELKSLGLFLLGISTLLVVTLYETDLEIRAKERACSKIEQLQTLADNRAKLDTLRQFARSYGCELHLQ